VIGFHRQDSTLFCDDVPLAALAETEGTPLYVYSAGVVRARTQAFQDALAGVPHAVHYALKANSNLSLVRLMQSLGCGADANSIGEVDVALRGGFRPSDVVFTGVGKSRAELARAVGLGLRSINAESAGEVARIDELARARGARARVALRVNPDVDAGSHPHISTGRRTNKFGVPLEDAAAIAREAATQPGVELVGLHVHIGSQLTTLDPLRQAFARLAELARELRDSGVRIEHLDVGGGLGISYDGAAMPSIEEYAALVRSALGATGLTVLVEPGRALVGPAGALVTEVVDVKWQSPDRLFVVLDAGMTELLRPALYGAYHRVTPIVERPGAAVTCDFVGPLCESSDVVGGGRPEAPPAVGDRFAVLDVGAYGFVMASNYNRRLLPAEVLVDGRTWRVVRRRQTIDDLLALET
jgi:diaminopimelate decarboxylase